MDAEHLLLRTTLCVVSTGTNVLGSVQLGPDRLLKQVCESRADHTCRCCLHTEMHAVVM